LHYSSPHFLSIKFLIYTRLAVCQPISKMAFLTLRRASLLVMFLTALSGSLAAPAPFSLLDARGTNGTLIEARDNTGFYFCNGM